MLAAATIALASSLVCGPPSRPVKAPPTIRLVSWLPDGSPLAPHTEARVALGYDEAPPVYIFYEASSTSSPRRPLDELGRAVAAGTASDVALIQRQDVPSAAHRGLARPLDGLVRADRLDLKRFMPAAHAENYGLDGKLYGLPASVAAQLLFWSKSAIQASGFDYRQVGLDPERPSVTWEQLRLLTIALSRQAQPDSSRRVGFLPNSEEPTLTFWAWQAGGAWVSGDGRRATFEDEHNVAALEWLALLAREAGGWSHVNHALQLHRASSAEIAPAGRHPLATGAAGMVMASNELLATLANAQPEQSVQLCQPPLRQTGALPVSLASGYSLLLLPEADTNHGMWAWEALRFLLSDRAVSGGHTAAAAAASSQGRRYVPTWTGQLKMDKDVLTEYGSGLEGIDKANWFALEVLRHCRWRERNPAAADLWPLLRRTQEEALAGRATPWAALKEAQATAQRLLDSAWERRPA